MCQSMFRFKNLIGRFGITLLVVLVVVVLTQIFFRYVLGSALPWTEEAARMLLIWTTFVGATALFVDNKLMKLDLFDWDKLGLLNSVRGIIHYIVIAVTLVYLTYYGYEIVELTKYNLMPTLKLSRGYFMYGSIVICSILMLFAFFSNSILSLAIFIRKRKN